MESVLFDIKNSFILFVTGLNWTFIFMFGLISYGIKNEPEFEWYNDLLKNSKMKTWIAGLIVMIVFCIFTYLEKPINFNSEYVSALLRSFMMTVVLSRIINSILNTYIDKRIKDLNIK